MAHIATETRNVSYAVMAHSSVGSMHEGEISAGLLDTLIPEKTRVASKMTPENLEITLTCVCQIIKQYDSYHECRHEENELAMVIHAD